MKQVSINSIEKAINKIDNLDDEGLGRISETYAVAQQTLLGYIMSASVEYQNEQLEGLLIYYYCLISEAFAQEQVKVRNINEDDIDAFEQPFFEMLDQYFESENEDIIHDFTEQSELIRFMMMEITTKDEDGTSLDDDTATQLFIVSAAMISLMSRGIEA
ncbi:MAG: hypothetical protein Crog4KO_15980 [Crocinitomicaceae bacterium]